MKKLIVVVTTLSITAVIIAFTQINHNDKRIEISVISSQLHQKNSSVRVNADYSDYSLNIEEMNEKAQLIITGTVINQEQFNDLVVVSTVKVTSVHKGKAWDEIQVNEFGTIGDSNVLGINQEYVLFLGEQGTGDNQHYITGGEQGAFEIVENGMLENIDPIMTEEINNIPVITRDGDSQYDQLLQSLE